MCTSPVQPICTFSCTAHFISLHILPLILFHYLFLLHSHHICIYIYSLVFLFHSFYCFYVIFILLSCFIFSFLHFPLSGPVLTNISLPIIPCTIVYVTNNKEPWTLNRWARQHRRGDVMTIWYKSMCGETGVSFWEWSKRWQGCRRCVFETQHLIPSRK